LRTAPVSNVQAWCLLVSAIALVTSIELLRLIQIALGLCLTRYIGEGGSTTRNPRVEIPGEMGRVRRQQANRASILI
jgi:hypothetical protein